MTPQWDHVWDGWVIGGMIARVGFDLVSLAWVLFVSWQWLKTQAKAKGRK